MTPAVVVRLPYFWPPLRSNDRMNRWRKAEWTSNIRHAAKILTKAQKLPPITGPVRVVFVWTVCDNHRRDVSASAPTSKAALDGIVDSGLLSGDHSTVVTSETCRIEVGDKPGCRIEIWEDA